MAGTILVGALAIVAAILCFLFWKLSQEIDSKYGYALQIFVFAFLLGVIMLLGKVSLDYKDNCSWLVSNSTISGSTTSYSYSYTCSTNTNNTARIFYEVTLWLTRIVMTYLFLAFAFEMINYFAWQKKGGGK
jgi:hypothetical protein